MSFLYPRTIAVYRQKTNAGPVDQAVGLVGYSGRENSMAASDLEGLALMMEDIPANILSRGVGRVARDVLPAAVTGHPQWRVLTQSLDRYAIRDNDIIVDDQGYRYQVAQNYWTPMGFKLDCVRLEA